jgi:hypothetical protein
VRISTLITPILAAVVVLACTSPSSQYDYDQSVDFGKYRRWAWLPRPQQQPSGDPRIDNSLTRQRIESAVSRNLAAKGYEQVDAEAADFRVGYVVTVEKRLDSSGVSTSIGFGRYSGGSGFGISIGGPGTPIREYEEGTLLIDIRDKDSDDLLWRGSSTSRLDEATTPEESEQKINGIVGEILANFPPGKND